VHCVYSTPSGREDRGVGPVHHEDSENSEGPWQQSSLHGLVQGQETDCQLFTGVEISRRLEPIPRLTPRFPALTADKQVLCCDIGNNQNLLFVVIGRESHCMGCVHHQQGIVIVMHNQWICINTIFSRINEYIVFLGACSDDALHLGNGLCLRTLRLCSCMWVSVSS
jgi:hypothetical protein